MSCLVESDRPLMTTMHTREMQSSLQSPEESRGQPLRAEDSLMSALLPAVLSDVYPTVLTTNHSCLTQVLATYTSLSSLRSLPLSPPPTSPGCPQLPSPPPTLVSTLSKLQMLDVQLPGGLGHAFHLETLSPRYYAMMYEAGHAPVMEELPGVSVIVSSLTLTTHHTSSLLLLTLQLLFLCVMVSVVTMIVTFPPPVTPHASPLPRCQWPAPASQSLPVTTLWPRRSKQRVDPIVHSGEGNLLPVPECALLFGAGHGRSEEGDLVSELTAARLWRCLRPSAHGTQTAMFEQTFVKIR